jgi:cardiolipin synthase
VESGRHTTQILASGPDQDFEAIKNMYFAAIAQARERVLVTTPYFVPDEAILAAMQSAALRGVDVRLLVPRMSDSRVITVAARSYFDECLRAGVRIFEYLPGMLHAKTLVVDDTFAAIGTANMDNRSFRLNFEVSAIVHGHTVAGTLATHFEEDCRHAREVHLGARAHLGLLSRLTESSARLLSPLL